MVAGIGKFREYFAGHEDQYAVIGGAAFKAFLDAGGYQARERSDGKKEFHRFHKPTDESFPFMIELFSRTPGMLSLPEDASLTSIPVEDDIVSLSAILLDEDYYQALRAAKRQLDGVTVIDETLLIPFKARAFLDLTERSKAGEKIDRKNIKKHRSDVFRLVQLLPKDASIMLPNPIRDDLRRFVELAEADKGLDLKDLRIPMSLKDATALLYSAYGLD